MSGETMPGWVCLDCGNAKTRDEMATSVPDLVAESGAWVGSCKECRA